ncbi:MAG: alpha/beta fold hydrolase [Gomphosphaeria aponina SAG 52.96 = DSM 107014]|uniref:Alpha/beta fold hydrolase n=1 Tax=Gomphosphaeria aponina SAG 52.96 = DSM 107014 TaxID=1521640 RepID=A0A941JS13_9CHRO|nr:alpha/beta fold hydrolase [Gomphosphaeria aponina SAG 52.96 = DSM 107014]
MNNSILDQPEVLRFLFHPRHDNSIPPAGVHNINVEVEGGIKVGGRLYPANTPTAPAMLFFHGNGEIAAEYDYIAPFFSQLGLTLLVMDYRGYGNSDGSPTTSNTLQDAVTIFHALGGIFASWGLSPGQVYVMGRSLGSAAAIEIAFHVGEQLAGLIIESGFAETFPLLARLGLQVTGVDETLDGIGNGRKIREIKTKTLIIHGEEDLITPLSQGRKLYNFCGAEEKKIVIIPDAGHNDLLFVGREEYFGAIASFCL